MPSTLDSAGRLLFRSRGWIPVPVGLWVVVVCWRGHISPTVSWEVDAVLNWVGVALGLAGLAIRFFTVALAPQVRAQSRQLSAEILHTEGPYAVARHPLYLGNALMVVGLLAVVARWEAVAIVVPTFVLLYGLIIAAEERALEARHADRWRAWAGRVKLFPSGRPGAAVAGPLDVSAALAREVTPAVSFGLTVVTLLTWEWWARGRLTDQRASALQLVAVALAVLVVVNKLRRLRR